MTAHTIHSTLIAVWMGILATEFVLELLPLRRPGLRPATAAFHFAIDLLFELPLLFGIVGSGLWLLRGRPLDGRLSLKLVGAAIAIAANLLCVGFVVARHRGPPAEAERRSRWIFGTAIVGLPAGLVALYVGLGYAGWL